MAVEIEAEHPGILTNHGYRMKASDTSRRRALNRAVRKEGYQAVSKALVNLIRWNKRDDPHLSAIASRDLRYIQRKYR